MKLETLELESLVGRHLLSGAFFDSINEDYSERQVLRFTLDDVDYEAVEEPGDAYRSYLDELRTTQTPPLTKFAPVEVDVRMKPLDETAYGRDEILQFINPKNGNAILEIGTSNADDYYPGFVAYFSPEHL